MIELGCAHPAQPKGSCMNGLIAGRRRRFDLGAGLALVVSVLVTGCGVQKHLTAPETGGAGTTGEAGTSGEAGTRGTNERTGEAGTTGDAGRTGAAGSIVSGRAGTGGTG